MIALTVKIAAIWATTATQPSRGLELEPTCPAEAKYESGSRIPS